MEKMQEMLQNSVFRKYSLASPLSNTDFNYFMKIIGMEKGQSEYTFKDGSG